MNGIDLTLSFNLQSNSALDTRLVVADETSRLALDWLYDGIVVFQRDVNMSFRWELTNKSQALPFVNSDGIWYSERELTLRNVSGSHIMPDEITVNKITVASHSIMSGSVEIKQNDSNNDIVIVNNSQGIPQFVFNNQGIPIIKGKSTIPTASEGGLYFNSGDKELYLAK